MRKRNLIVETHSYSEVYKPGGSNQTVSIILLLSDFWMRHICDSSTDEKWLGEVEANQK